MNPRLWILAVSLPALTGAACIPGTANGRPAAASEAGAGPSPTATVVWFPATATPTRQPAPTALPTADRRPGIGAVLLADNFSSAADWNTAIGDEASVTVADEGLTIAAQPGIAPVTSFRQGMVFGDMYAEVTARPSLCRGADAYGLLFRAPNNVAYYRFALACDGTASLERVSLGSPRVLQPPMPSADVPLGAPGAVRLGVWANGEEFRLFLNGRYQFTATDASYRAGGIGVFAHAGGETPVTVTFSSLAVSRLDSSVPSPTPTP